MNVPSLMPIMQSSVTVGYVPWSMFTVEDDTWARKNHRQSLEHLASRGGLGICELVAILDHRRWHKMTMAEGWSRLWEISSERGRSVAVKVGG